MSKRRKYYTSYELEASYKRAIRDGISDPIDQDFTMKAVNGALYKLLGDPGKRTKAVEGSGTNDISTHGDFTPMSGRAMYSSAQIDDAASKIAAADHSTGGVSWLDRVIGGVIGLGRDVLGYYYADKAAETAYNRQREYADDYLTAQAQVRQYQEAGLNPMGLAGGSSVGSSSAPGVGQARAPGNSAMGEVLGTLLNYKTKMAEIDVAKERNKIQRDSVDSQIRYRAERQIYQEKLNAWFETNQVANLNRIQADTDRLLAQAQTEEQKAAVLFQQAVGEEIKNRYADAYNQNLLRLQDAEYALKQSATAENYARCSEIRQHIQNMVAECALTVSKTDAMKEQTRILGIQGDMMEYKKSKQAADRTWEKVGQTISMVGQVAGAAVNIFSCFTPIPSINFGSGQSSRPVNYKPSEYGDSEYGLSSMF